MNNQPLYYIEEAKKMKYKSSLSMLEDNFDRFKHEIYSFEYANKKRAGIQARQTLSNIKKICLELRKEINQDIKKMPVIKKNISKEALEEAKCKRQATIAAKKNKQRG